MQFIAPVAEKLMKLFSFVGLNQFPLAVLVNLGIDGVDLSP